jgi:hypothetical protein
VLATYNRFGEVTDVPPSLVRRTLVHVLFAVMAKAFEVLLRVAT